MEKKSQNQKSAVPNRVIQKCEINVESAAASADHSSQDDPKSTDLDQTSAVQIKAGLPIDFKIIIIFFKMITFTIIWD